MLGFFCSFCFWTPGLVQFANAVPGLQGKGFIPHVIQWTSSPPCSYSQIANKVVNNCHWIDKCQQRILSFFIFGLTIKQHFERLYWFWKRQAQLKLNDLQRIHYSIVTNLPYRTRLRVCSMSLQSRTVLKELSQNSVQIRHYLWYTRLWTGIYFRIDLGKLEKMSRSI